MFGNNDYKKCYLKGLSLSVDSQKEIGIFAYLQDTVPYSR
jgi:hypothetical protein